MPREQSLNIDEGLENYLASCLKSYTPKDERDRETYLRFCEKRYRLELERRRIFGLGWKQFLIAISIVVALIVVLSK